ncbi:TIGR03936 family radical SAM-associated protein [Raineyella sp.]|uniref:TIGR03936 family radical SAM-associated protein n=1 Tax=Raineyella sp. TaxID=1911550 RepID=UPI002B1E99A4|nr:TIGR03936 family radical SAM-associated protein [Raineyella sp.]MEA5154207.1 TIGR03936 family radical SAM-associated protein [Raineyella sp.]
MASQQQPEQQAPPVQRLRIRYAKRGRARFASHRDVVRAFERALRRAHVPMAYSSGFNPHPRISYANSSPTGAATEAEYLEIGLAETCDPDKVLTALNEAMPDGLVLVEIRDAVAGKVSDGLEASVWRVELPGADGRAMADAVRLFLDRDELVTERMTKNGPRSFDARADVKGISAYATGGVPMLDLVIAHGEPLVRPDDVLRVLHELHPDFAIADPARITRLIQGRLELGRVIAPW